jgi:hypothetical protein
MNTKDLEDRVQKLEDIEEIRALKSRYFHCADQKDPQGMRSCFKDGPVYIDYGVVGKFDNADDLVKVFKEIGCHDHMVEMHHGMNPLINTKDKTLTQLGGYYEDEYQLVNGVWKISRTRFVATSTLVMDINSPEAKVAFAGRPA